MKYRAVLRDTTLAEAEVEANSDKEAVKLIKAKIANGDYEDDPALEWDADDSSDIELVVVTSDGATVWMRGDDDQ